MTNIQKCGVIGVGFVGATCAYTLAVSGLFSDLVLVDMNRDKAIGEAADINHGVAFSKPCRVMAGDYADLAECGLIIIAAGANQKPGESRLELLGRNKGILSSVIAQLTAVNREAILLVVSNPVDVLTCLAQQLSGFPAGRVLGSGTVLDTARLKYLLGQRLGVDSRNVHAFIIGEHGDSELAVWSAANVSGIGINDFFRLRGIENATEIRASVEESVRNSAYEIIEKKRATYFGIAPSVTRICEAIVRDQKSIMTVSNYRTDVQGVPDVVMSLPAIVGSKGVEFPIPLQLSIDEAELLHSSAQTLKNTLNQIDFSL